jgi:hypothetical protein
MLGEFIEKLFDEKLQWFKQGKEPLHIIKIMGSLSGKESTFLLDELSIILK